MPIYSIILSIEFNVQKKKYFFEIFLINIQILTIPSNIKKQTEKRETKRYFNREMNEF